MSPALASLVRVPHPINQAAGGLALLGRGAALLIRRPRMFLLGAIPPAITSFVFLGLLIVLITQLSPLVDWLTPFARGWPEGAAVTVRVAIGVATIGVAVLLMVVTFTSLTLLLGSPLYDKISEETERELGPVPTYDEPLVTEVTRSVRQSLALIAVSLLGALPLLLAGLLPVIGQTAVPVVAACFGGWLLALELTGSTFQRRGILTLAERRAALRGQRFRVLGFAAPVFALLAVPFLAVVVFPAAAAGATLLARQILEPAAAHPAGTKDP